MTAGQLIRADAGDAANGAALPGAALPGAWRTGLLRGRLEILGFFREKEALAFIFALPAVLLVLLGTIFGHQAAAEGVTVGQLFTAGMIAGGIGSTCYQGLGIGIAAERDLGVLRRLQATPLPPTGYFIGKVIQVLVATVAEVALLIAVGVAFYHLDLPTSLARWWTFTWVFVLGSVACSLLGIAASGLPRSYRSASAVIMFPYIVLQFISGVYVPFSSVPRWLQQVAAVFPLKWMSEGLRSVFLPSRAARLEPAGSWEHGRVALVLAVWIAGGLVLCLTTFRWRSSRDS
jgi:ABC-2 type transport system permease protein